jgi:hypothetical protein
MFDASRLSALKIDGSFRAHVLVLSRERWRASVGV